MCEIRVLGLARWVYILCIWWFERSFNDKNERAVILVECIHYVVIYDS